jgi:hypothetical protein
VAHDQPREQRHFWARRSYLVHRWCYLSGTLAFDAADGGTATMPVTVGSYGIGRATISAGSGKGISIYNTAGFVVKDLIVAGEWNATNQNGNDDAGAERYTDIPGGVKLSCIRIDNVEAHGFKSGGIIVGAYPADGSKSGFEDASITRSVVHNNGDVGIMSYGYFGYGSGWAPKNMYVGYCTVYNNQGIANNGNNSGSGIVLSDVDGAVIERSVAHNNGALNNHGGGGPYASGRGMQTTSRFSITRRTATKPARWTAAALISTAA